MRFFELARLHEEVVIRDRASSDVDGRLRDLIIVHNPSRREAKALMDRSVAGELRGFLSDHAETAGQIYLWDAYITDHARAEDLLRENGLPVFWPRFSLSADDLAAHRLSAYIDQDIDEDAWRAIPTRHLERMFGQKPDFIFI